MSAFVCQSLQLLHINCNSWKPFSSRIIHFSWHRTKKSILEHSPHFCSRFVSARKSVRGKYHQSFWAMRCHQKKIRMTYGSYNLENSGPSIRDFLKENPTWWKPLFGFKNFVFYVTYFDSHIMWNCVCTFLFSKWIYEER